MKIAHVCPRYYPYIGGVNTHVKEISERLVKRGYEVEILTTDPSGILPVEEEINGVRVRRFKSWAPSESYYFSMALKRYLVENSENYDVVHTHSYHAFPSLYAAQAKGRNKLVFTPHYHGTGHTFLRKLLHIPYKYVAKTIFDKADQIICVSNYERQLITKRFKVSERKIVVIPNGVNLEEFTHLKKREKDYKTILYVGRLEKYKGLDYLVKALRKLGKGFFLEIVGGGPYKKSLVKLADRLGVRNRVRFYQDLPRKELLQRYADADIFVMLSKHEAFCISVAEALASKTPCIVANASALREWVDDENCFGINYPIDVNELVRLIKKALNIRVKNLKLLTWDEVAERISTVYTALNEA